MHRLTPKKILLKKSSRCVTVVADLARVLIEKTNFYGYILRKCMKFYDPIISVIEYEQIRGRSSELTVCS